MEKMDIDPMWHLADVLSLQDAAALIAGFDPNEIDRCRNDSGFQQNYPRLYPVEKALRNAVRSDLLEPDGSSTIAIVRPPNKSKKSEVDFQTIDHPSMSHTRVKVDNLRRWLESRGFKTGFFFPQADDTPDFLDPSHKNYAPKLAAAIKAWQAVNANPELLVGKTVKKALIKWLHKNADQLELTKDDGNPNEQGIKDIAKIANWDTKGGAPKTPG
jgi:hypothetical protein